MRIGCDSRSAPLVVSLAVVLSLATAPALGQDCPELVGRVPGEILAVTVSGEYTYLGASPGLIIADASTPSAPWAVGEVSLPGEGAYDIAVSGTHAYVANGDAGLRVIDISLPWAPFEVGSVDTPGWPMSVVVADNYAYVGDTYGPYVPGVPGLRVIDVSNPATPVVVGLFDTPWEVRDLAVVGSYAYVLYLSANYQYGFHVIDISDPSSPVEVGAVSGVGGYALAVEGSYAFVVGGVGLAVIDVSTPSAPVYLGFVYLGGGGDGYAEGVALLGNYAFVVTTYYYPFEPYGQWGLFQVVDVSTPTAPVLVAELWPLGEAAHQVAVSGIYPYVVGDGLRVMDVSTPSAPVEVGGFASVVDPKTALAASGGYAYVRWWDYHWAPMGGGVCCLGAVDLSSQSLVGVTCPTECGHLPTSTTMAVEDGFAYVSDAWVSAGSRLEVIDVSAPSAPGLVGTLDLGSADVVSDLAVAGGHVFLVQGECEAATLWSALRVIDVSTPSTPVEVGAIEMPCALGVAAEGGYAYVADGDSGLLVIDVRTPSAPVEVGSLDTLGYASDVAVEGAYAYVADGSAGMRVIDVSTPSAPVEVGFLDTLGDAAKIAVSHGYAYVADPFGSLRAIDVSAPEAPFDVGLYEVNNSAGLLGVAVSDSFVLLGFDGPGLYILGCSILFVDGFESGDTSEWSATVP